MAASESDEITMYIQSDDRASSTSRVFSTRNRSVSMPLPSNCQDSSENEYNLVRITGPSSDERRTSFVQMSNPLYYNSDRELSDMLDAKFHSKLYKDAKCWAKRMCTFLHPYIPKVMNPQAKVVQHWNKFFAITGLFAVFSDLLFVLLLSVHQSNKCIVLSRLLTATYVISRSVTDFIYLIHILLQTYITSEDKFRQRNHISVDARNNFLRYVGFGLDLFGVLPIPQIIMLLILRDSMRASVGNFSGLMGATSVLSLLRCFRCLPLLWGSTITGSFFESLWAISFTSLLIIIWLSHLVGSLWYLTGIERVEQCFRNACHNSNITISCRNFIDCGHGNDYRGFENDSTWDLWKTNENATACFWKDGTFDFGMFEHAVNLTTHKRLLMRYLHSFFWGFQQTSTLGGNLVPSYSLWEVYFTILIIGIGLVYFPLLLGTMQCLIQAFVQGYLEVTKKRGDVKDWMRHLRLREEIRREVLDAERFNHEVTWEINEEMPMENLPEDLQRKIKFDLLIRLVKKVRIFNRLDEPIIDAICDRLRIKRYIKGSKILSLGGLVDKMVYIIRGEMESIGEDGTVVPLSEGKVCGEELLASCLEHSSVNKGPILLSNRLVKCLTNVEALVLRAADLEEVTSHFARFSADREEVTSLFSRFLGNPRAQGATRYKSPYPRGRTRRFQVAWRRHRKK